ncbi:c-type cytochrome domain-containing protein [Sphingobacterium faecium]|uniref:c-type cytochrome domain-containing protein n=1 Tax=Sphingobacterium faecium TaxID=34087 RepID=UPI00129115E1|nr:c-type cytochrome domain-containing protein [Sphingobacterium faecium]
MILFFEELMNFTGRWHPILVHLPIGMLIIAFVMALFSRREHYKNIGPAISLSLLLGSIAAVLACFTGYLLSLQGGYEQETLNFHQWLGLAVAVISLFLYFLYKEGVRYSFMVKLRSYRLLLLFVMFILIGFTGHFGGTLTHGKGYFKDALPSAIKDAVGIEQVSEETVLLTNVQQAQVYSGIIQPILKQRCESCHGEKKKEGGLALHDQAHLLKGGDGGTVLVANDLEKSELYARLILPEGHKKRMPPKGRKPITAEQIKLIGWWVKEGADFGKKSSDLAQTAEIKEILGKLEKGSEPTSPFEELPEAKKLPADFVQQLQAKGIKVLPIASNSEYVAINAINYPEFNDQDLKDLLKIKDNIVQLKLGNTVITDQGLKMITEFPNLMKLHLENTKITDVGIGYLNGHPALSYINLFAVPVTDKGLEKLNKMPKLKQIYAYQTKATLNGVENLKKIAKQVVLDTGSYQLPFLASDTVRF